MLLHHSSTKYVLTLCIVTFIVVVFLFVRPVLFPSDTRTDASEGNCSLLNNPCTWAGEFCGGGHGICTDTPQKYSSKGSICDVNTTFPANQGYKCTCLVSQGKCGWVK